MIKHRLSSEEGFTLIELLVVILIIGILAAIALPTFLNQQRKGQDAGAKSNARNVANQFETCYADTRSYEFCPITRESTGLPIGLGPGEVSAGSMSPTSYMITAKSQSGCDFVVIKNSSGTRRTTTGLNCSATSW